jgi:transcriptional regulator with XRE-family HTH domain
VETKRPRHRPRRPITVDGKTLTAARINAGMSMEEVAAELNCNKSTISRWERNKQAPRPEDILKMMTLYRADFRIIAGGNNAK